MLLGVKRELGHDREEKLFHLVDTDTGRGLSFYDCGTLRFCMVSDVPEENRKFLSRLPKNNYLRAVVPQQEFERMYAQISAAEDKKLYAANTFHAIAQGAFFKLEDFPAINSICTGNFVDIIMENAAHPGLVRRPIVRSRNERGRNSDDSFYKGYF